MTAAAARSPRPATDRSAGTGGGSVAQRLGARALMLGVAVLMRLPDRVVYRVAHALGVALSYVLRRRRALVRDNLGRVCRWLDATGAATPRVQAAARDQRRLDALVRDAFGHWVTTYAESALAPRYDAAALRSRLAVETPDVAEAALAPVPVGGLGRLFVSLHFGSVELAGLYAARLGHIPMSVTMERVSNPAMRRYFERVRGGLGVTVVPEEDAAATLVDALRHGRGVGLVADRVLSGHGSRVELFGAPARLPGGAAVLAVESGAPFHVLAVRRSGPGSWVGRLETVDVPREGSRRERVRATLDAQARCFERFVAAAPEQWWTVFFPIWEADRS